VHRILEDFNTLRVVGGRAREECRKGSLKELETIKLRRDSSVVNMEWIRPRRRGMSGKEFEGRETSKAGTNGQDTREEIAKSHGSLDHGEAGRDLTLGERRKSRTIAYRHSGFRVQGDMSKLRVATSYSGPSISAGTGGTRESGFGIWGFWQQGKPCIVDP
jgi:hypothetical protein